MSSLARRIQIRIFRNSAVDKVPIVDSDPVKHRWPFSRAQIAFLGDQRITRDNIPNGPYRPVLEALAE